MINIFGHNAFAFLDRISYSLGVTHITFAKLRLWHYLPLRLAINQFPLNNQGTILKILYILCNFIPISMLTYKYIETPFIQYGLKLSNSLPQWLCKTRYSILALLTISTAVYGSTFVVDDEVKLIDNKMLSKF